MAEDDFDPDLMLAIALSQREMEASLVRPDEDLRPAPPEETSPIVAQLQQLGASISADQFIQLNAGNLTETFDPLLSILRYLTSPRSDQEQYLLALLEALCSAILGADFKKLSSSNDQSALTLLFDQIIRFVLIAISRLATQPSEQALLSRYVAILEGICVTGKVACSPGSRLRKDLTNVPAFPDVAPKPSEPTSAEPQESISSAEHLQQILSALLQTSNHHIHNTEPRTPAAVSESAGAQRGKIASQSNLLAENARCLAQEHSGVQVLISSMCKPVLQMPTDDASLLTERMLLVGRVLSFCAADAFATHRISDSCTDLVQVVVSLLQKQRQLFLGAPFVDAVEAVLRLLKRLDLDVHYNVMVYLAANAVHSIPELQTALEDSTTALPNVPLFEFGVTLLRRLFTSLTTVDDVDMESDRKSRDQSLTLQLPSGQSFDCYASSSPQERVRLLLPGLVAKILSLIVCALRQTSRADVLSTPSVVQPVPVPSSPERTERKPADADKWFGARFADALNARRARFASTGSGGGLARDVVSATAARVLSASDFSALACTAVDLLANRVLNRDGTHFVTYQVRTELAPLHLDALVCIARNISPWNPTAEQVLGDARFRGHFRQLAHVIAVNDVLLSPALQEYLVKKSLATADTSLVVPLESLMIGARMLIKRKNTLVGQEDPLAFSILSLMLTSLDHMAQADEPKDVETLNYEHLLLQLLLFHMQSPLKREMLLSLVAESVVRAATAAVQRPLATARLALIFHYMLCHFDDVPQWLVGQLEVNLLGREIPFAMPDFRPIHITHVLDSVMHTPSAIVYYDLATTESIAASAQSAISRQIGGVREALCALLDASSDADSQVVLYRTTICWSLLYILPAPSQEIGSDYWATCNPSRSITLINNRQLVPKLFDESMNADDCSAVLRAWMQQLTQLQSAVLSDNSLVFMTVVCASLSTAVEHELGGLSEQLEQSHTLLQIVVTLLQQVMSIHRARCTAAFEAEKLPESLVRTLDMVLAAGIKKAVLRPIIADRPQMFSVLISLGWNTHDDSALYELDNVDSLCECLDTAILVRSSPVTPTKNAIQALLMLLRNCIQHRQTDAALGATVINILDDICLDRRFQFASSSASDIQSELEVSELIARIQLLQHHIQILLENGASNPVLVDVLQRLSGFVGSTERGGDHLNPSLLLRIATNADENVCCLAFELLAYVAESNAAAISAAFDAFDAVLRVKLVERVFGIVQQGSSGSLQVVALRVFTTLATSGCQNAVKSAVFATCQLAIQRGQAVPDLFSLAYTLCDGYNGYQEFFDALLQVAQQLSVAEELSEAQQCSAILVLTHLTAIVKLFKPSRPANTEGARSVEGENKEELPLHQQLCTFTETGSNFTEQHWYFCYTCNLTYSEGCCSVCARVCHAGHEVSYSRKSRFFCDCGAGAVRGCTCVSLVARPPPAAQISAIPQCVVSETIDQLAALPKLEPAQRGAAPERLELVDNMVQNVMLKLAGLVREPGVVTQAAVDMFAQEKSGSTVSDLFKKRACLKPGSFDFKTKAETPVPRELKQIFSGNVISRNVMDVNDRGRCLIAEGEKLSVLDVTPLLNATGTSALDKDVVRVLGQGVFSGDVVSIVFNPCNQNYAAVAGLRECQVVVLTSGGEVASQLSVELQLEALGDDLYIRQVMWLPGSQVKLAVVTNQFVKIYDLSADKLAPTHYFAVLEDSVCEAAFVGDADAKLFLLVLTSSGVLLRQELPKDGDSGQYVLTDNVDIPSSVRGRKGLSLTYSAHSQLMIVSFEDGRVFAGKLNSDCSAIASQFLLTGGDRIKLSPVRRVVDVLGLPGTFVCLSLKSHSAVGLQLAERTIQWQALAKSRTEGFRVYAPPHSSVRCALLLEEDGSLVKFDLPQGVAASTAGAAPVESALATMWQRVGGQRAASATTATAPSFPVDFFEHVRNVTRDITLGGDVLQAYTSETAKARLRNNDEYLCSPNQEQFRITIQLPNPSMILVGLRVCIGHNSTQHVPKELRVFSRTVKTTEGVRKWYDIPFTREESLSAENEITLVTSGTYTTGNAPVVDMLEVYALPKDEFGYREAKYKKPDIAAGGAGTEVVLYALRCAIALLSACNVAPGKSEGQLLQVLSRLLVSKSAEFLRKPIKKLLRQLCTDQQSYDNLKDAAALEHSARVLQEHAARSAGSYQTMSGDELVDLLAVGQRVALKRGQNLGDFIRTHSEFTTNALAAFWALYQRRNLPSDDVEPLVNAVVSVLFTQARSDHNQAQALASLNELILSHHENVRELAALQFITLLKSLVSAPTTPTAPAIRHRCDSCGLKPITGKRWHCDVCEDFDLCDTCHREAKEKSHDTSHGMTAIPIPASEDAVAAAAAPADVVMADVDADADDEDAELKMALALSMEQANPVQSSSQFIAQVFSSLIAAIGQLKDRSTAACLPFAQVLCALATLSPDVLPQVEQCTQSLMQLLQVDTPVTNVELFTPKLQTTLIALMMFSRLVRVKGASHGQAEPLAVNVAKKVAAGSMRVSVHQFLIGTLREVVKYLHSMAKREPTTTNSADQLLKVEQAERLRNLAPFFNEQYVAAHAENLFSEHVLLLCENVLRAMYGLCLNAVEGFAPFNSDEIRKLVCSIIALPQSSTCRRYAKIVLLQLCNNNRGEYYNARDFFSIDVLLSKISRISEQSSQFRVALAYDVNVKLVTYLTQLVDLVDLRPLSWRQFCVRHSEAVRSLFRMSLSVGGDALSVLLRLISRIFGELTPLLNVKPDQKSDTKEKGEAKAKRPIAKEAKAPLMTPAPVLALTELATPSAPLAELGSPDVPLPALERSLTVSVDTVSDRELLEGFIRRILLDPPMVNVRTEAKNVLVGVWTTAIAQSRSDVLDMLLQALVTVLPQLPAYGKNGSEFMELLTYLITHERANLSAVQPILVDSLATAMRQQNELLAEHPNAQLYHTLGDLIDLDGFFLESDPCFVCNDPDVPVQSMKLDTIRSEAKFTASAQVYKLKGSFVISKLALRLSQVQRSRMVRTISVYTNNKSDLGINDLKNTFSLWTRAKTVTLQPAAQEASIDFPLPVTACNLMIEFASFYDNKAMLSAEKVQCPRCNRPVPDRSGICRSCRENAHQCRQCRNINYEDLFAFLCNECGFSKYGRFEFTMVAKVGVQMERIESEEGRQKTVLAIQKELETAHKQYERLQLLRKPLAALVSAFPDAPTDSKLTVNVPPQQPVKFNKKVIAMGVLYNRECKAAFDALSKAMQSLLAKRRELVRYTRAQSQHTHVRPANHCYGCATSFVGYTLTLLEHLARIPLVRSALAARIAPELASHSIRFGTEHTRGLARHVLCEFTHDNLEVVKVVCQSVQQRVNFVLDNHGMMDVATVAHGDLLLVNEFCAVVDMCFEARLRLLLPLLFKAIDVGSGNAVVCDQVILPLLRTLRQVCTGNSSDEHNENLSQASPARLVDDDALPDLTRQEDREPSPVTPEGDRIPADALMHDWEADMMNDVIDDFDGGAEEDGAGDEHNEDGDDGDEGSEDGEGEHDEDDHDVDEEEGSDEEIAVVRAPSTTGVSPVTVTPSLGTATAINAAPVTHSNVAVVSVSMSDRSAPSIIYSQWAAGEQSCESWAAMRCGVGQADSAAGKRIREQYLSQKYGRRWMNKVLRASRTDAVLGALDVQQWVATLLLNPCSVSIRREVVALVKDVCGTSEDRCYRILDMLLQMLPTVVSRGNAAAQYFELLTWVASSNSRKLYIVARKNLPTICAAITAEALRIESLEELSSGDLSEGLVVKTLVDMLKSLLDLPTVLAVFKRDGYVKDILGAFLRLRGLIAQRTKFTDDAAAALLKIMEQLRQTEQDKKHFIAACVRALDSQQAGMATVYVLEQLCDIICPTKVAPQYLVALNKASSQEEYIRGQMTKNPYSTSDVGPLMRDVKNRICTDLEMTGLIEDDFGMELLVAGQIIKLDLPVVKVYEKVWKAFVLGRGRQPPFPPMAITYRLQGLDGEATEAIVETLPDDEEAAVDPEEEFKIALVLSECGGLASLIHRLGRVHDFHADLRLAQLLLRLLTTAVKLRANRRALLRLDGIQKLLEVLKETFPHETLAEVAENILLVVEALVSEANVDHEAQLTAQPLARHSSIASLEEGAAKSQMTLFLERLGSPLVRSNKQIVRTMTRILPFLTYGLDMVMEQLVSFFLPHLDWAAYDATGHRHESTQLLVECFVNMCHFMSDAHPDDETSARLKDIIERYGITQAAVEYLVRAFPDALVKDSEEWTAALSLPALPLVEALLAGLAVHHEPSQEMLQRAGAIKVLHRLEGVASTRNIGPLAESVLEALKDNETIAMELDQTRDATEREKKEKARLHRERMLQEIGVKFAPTSDASSAFLVAAKKITGMEDISEEAGLQCCICHEGYSFRPTEPLGVYTSSVRTTLPLLDTSHRQELGYHTQTHFTVIHLSCHRAATRAEREKRQPKSEWDAAALRNSNARCNNIFPLLSPHVPADSYSSLVDKYWQTMAGIGRVDAPHFRLLGHDMAHMLLAIAREEVFKLETHGGTRAQNLSLVPYMVLMGHHLLDVKQGQRVQCEKILQQFLAQQPSQWQAGCAQTDSVAYMLSLTFFVQSLQEWKSTRLAFIKRAIVYGDLHAKLAGPLAAAARREPSEADTHTATTPWDTSRVMLMLVALVDVLHDTMQQTGDVKSDDSAAWVTTLKTRLQTDDLTITNALRETVLPTFEQETLMSGDFMEYFDITGMLSEVLSDVQDCDEFAARTIRAAQA